MTTSQIPLDINEFLQKHGKDKSVTAFSREAIELILKRIKNHKSDGRNALLDWRVFFTSTKELWSDGVILIPRDSLNLSPADIERLDEIKGLKESNERCSDLIYRAAVEISRKNGFERISNSRFLI